VVAKVRGGHPKTIYLWEKGWYKPSPLALEKLEKLEKRGEEAAK